MKSCFVKSDERLIHMGNRGNYDWMSFLTSPRAFTGVQTNDSVFTKPNILTPESWLLPIEYHKKKFNCCPITWPWVSITMKVEHPLLAIV